MEITKTNEVELSGGSSRSRASSSDSSSSLSPCTWRPRKPRPGCGGCGRDSTATAAGRSRGWPAHSAAGDSRGRDLRDRKALQRPPREPNGQSSATSSSSGSGSSRSSSTDSSSTSENGLRGRGGAGAGRAPARSIGIGADLATLPTVPWSSSCSGRDGVPRGRGVLHALADGHHPLGHPPGHPPHPYRQDVEHRGRSFSLEQMWRIERENQDLLRRLRACRRVAPPSAPTPIRRITASSAINRTARQKQIDRENGIIRRRLQDIQQSTSLLGLRTSASASGPGAGTGTGTGATAAQRSASAASSLHHHMGRGRGHGHARPRHGHAPRAL